MPKSFLKPKKELGETFFPRVLVFGGAIVLLIMVSVLIIFAKANLGRFWLPILISVCIMILSLMTWAGSSYPNRLRKRIAEVRRRAIRSGKYL